MKSQSLDRIVEYADRLLDTAGFEDYPGAVNGLQVENRGRVTSIAAAVDASIATVRMAVEQGASLLLVHHGLFWGPTTPWTGRRIELIRYLVEHDLAVYSSHLPLDAHPRIGNNASLARALKLRNLVPFLPTKGRMIGLVGEVRSSRSRFHRMVSEAVGGSSVTLLPGGTEAIHRVGVVTGGAGGELKFAAEAGIDAFVTGEGPHWTHSLAEDLGINVFYAGHYATETFGVRALAAELGEKFKLPWSFLDHPSGL